MGLRTSVLKLLTAPAASVLDGAIRDVVEEVLEARAPSRAAEVAGVAGAIVGKALYEGLFTVGEARRACLGEER